MRVPRSFISFIHSGTSSSSTSILLLDITFVGGLFTIDADDSFCFRQLRLEVEEILTYLYLPLPNESFWHASRWEARFELQYQSRVQLHTADKRSNPKSLAPKNNAKKRTNNMKCGMPLQIFKFSKPKAFAPNPSKWQVAKAPNQRSKIRGQVTCHREEFWPNIRKWRTF